VDTSSPCLAGSISEGAKGVKAAGPSLSRQCTQRESRRPEVSRHGPSRLVCGPGHLSRHAIKWNRVWGVTGTVVSRADQSFSLRLVRRLHILLAKVEFARSLMVLSVRDRALFDVSSPCEERNLKWQPLTMFGA
jgi:hypothetical protein